MVFRSEKRPVVMLLLAVLSLVGVGLGGRQAQAQRAPRPFPKRGIAGPLSRAAYAPTSRGRVPTPSVNFRIAPGPSNGDAIGNPNDFGDYTGLDFHAGVFVPIWADNSTQLGNNPNPPSPDAAIARVTVGAGGPS